MHFYKKTLHFWSFQYNLYHHAPHLRIAAKHICDNHLDKAKDILFDADIFIVNRSFKMPSRNDKIEAP